MLRKTRNDSDDKSVCHRYTVNKTVSDTEMYGRQLIGVADYIQ